MALTEINKELLDMIERLINYLREMNVYEKPYSDSVDEIEKRANEIRTNQSS